jgi:TolB-like protein/Tfp pilus assembly protein PilF
MAEPRVSVQLLGKVSLHAADGRPATVPGRRSAALLGCLAEPDAVWTRERLAGLLWPGRGPEHARASLRQELLRLRRAIGLPAAETSALLPDRIEFDVRRFLAARESGEFEAALELYQGAFLEEIEADHSPFGDWLSSRRRTLQEMAADCVLRLLQAAQERGDLDSVERLARRLLGLAPGSEEAHRWLIRCHARRRDLGKVLDQFRRCGEALSLRHGAEPSAETRELVDAVVAELTGVATPVRPSLPDKPSIVVLPFANIEADPDQAYFAEGMVDEVITALSRIRWLFVIARNASFSYQGRAVDVRQIGQELGVRYALEGSVRRAGERMRITCQLVDASTATNVWSDRYEGRLQDVFELQDRVATAVAGAIEPTVEAAEARRSVGRPTGDPSAYDLYLRALPHLMSWEKERIFQAIALLDQAIQRDPNFGQAMAYAACCRVQLNNNGWSVDEAANWREGLALARRALQVDPDNPLVLGNAGMVLGYFIEDIDSAIALVERAVTLNPSFAMGWQWHGFLNLLKGELAVAVEDFERSMRLSPSRDRWNASCLAGIGIARFFERRFDHAAAILVQVLQELPTFASAYRFLAATYVHLGRLDEAGAVIRRLQALTPEARPRGRLYRNAEHRQLYLDGMNAALAAAVTPPRRP